MARKRKPAPSPATAASIADVGWWRCPRCNAEVALPPRDRVSPPGCLDCLFGKDRQMVPMEPADAPTWAAVKGGAQ